MAAWTRDDVKNIAPEFGVASDQVLDRYIAWASSEVNEDVHGARAARAGALLTAHLLTVLPYGVSGSNTSSSQSAGPVVRERVGDVEVQYSDPSSSISQAITSAGLGQSKYGVEYSRLVRLAACGPWAL
jgi:hypothetical protein